MQTIILSGLKPLASLMSGVSNQKKLFILIYHRVLDKPDLMRSGEVNSEIFDWQMALIAHYFNVLPLATALEKMASNSLPPRAVCITFDDGYADNYLNALPILKQYQLSATFFIASGYLDGGRMWNDTIIETLRRYPHSKLNLTEIGLATYPTSTETEKALAANQIIQQIKHLDMDIRADYTHHIAAQVDGLPDNLMLTSEQLIKLHQSGMEIGGHTVTHPIMAKCPISTLKQEVTDNKMALESLLATPIRFFAYPNGKPGQDYLPEHIQLIQNSGYQAAVSTQWGVANHQTDLFQLPRFTPWDKHPVKFMLRMLRMLSYYRF